MSKVRLVLEDPHGFLRWLAAAIERQVANLDEVDVAQAFAIAATAALARTERPERIRLVGDASGASRFAHALGVDQVLTGADEPEARERGRTVTLTRVKGRGPKEQISSKIVKLLLPSTPETLEAANLFRYVLVELLRNVGQHSQDPLGGIVAAQINDAGPYANKPALQLVVVDNGIGIFEALRRARPSITTASEAIVRALEPHVSGAFAEGESGSGENAGLGLFFIAEMAKLTDGRLFVASRGATLFLDRSDDELAQPVLTNGDAPDYPGTLVVFETEIGHVHDYDGIMARIRDAAKERTPQRIVQHWLRFSDAPAGVLRILIGVASEDTAEAQELARTTLHPRVTRREPVVLDFKNMRVCTQSYLHALLHETVRLAWAVKTPIYVMNASPAVRAHLELVEAYSLGG
ncbi:MAG: hypothetical protein A2138_24940 [Deltaproteobacteria bacterium RBG_16_71_12]|nr:MAG: hypothetical protein A2138_24940 [Deltaproteobacteria bacterium RBG_16_71_12]